nr:unknown [Ipomoea trifida]
MKIKVGVESYLSGGIAGVELFLHLRLLLVKLTNALNHFIKNLSGNPVIENLKETPGLTCIPNFFDDFRTASWVGMDAFHVYDGNLNLRAPLPRFSCHQRLSVRFSDHNRRKMLQLCRRCLRWPSLSLSVLLLGYFKH